MVFPVGPFKDSYNLNSFGGPGRNAYKSIAFLQKPGTQQSSSYRMEPYTTFCRGHMIKAFVDKMVSPISNWVAASQNCPREYFQITDCLHPSGHIATLFGTELYKTHGVRVVVKL